MNLRGLHTGYILSETSFAVKYNLSRKPYEDKFCLINKTSDVAILSPIQY
jgi:hypothetical protein